MTRLWAIMMKPFLWFASRWDFMAIVMVLGLMGCGPNSVSVLDGNTPVYLNITIIVEPNAINVSVPINAPINFAPTVNVDAHLLKGVQNEN